MSSSGALSEAATLEHTPETLDGLLEKMQAQGLQGEQVEQFRSLLHSCSIRSIGALRAFGDSLPELIDTMFDSGSALHQLQAKGFLAALRVRACPLTLPALPLTLLLGTARCAFECARRT
jgi:hypothetical protein